MICFAANIKLKLKKTQKITKKTGIFRRFLLILKAFMQFIQFWLKTSGKTDHGCDPKVLPVLLTPLAPRPWGAVK